MNHDRYPIARERIVKQFGSISKFCKKTNIPKATVVRVLNGKYGQRDTDDSRQRKRIEEAMQGSGMSREETRNLWVRIQEEASSSIITMDGRRLKISTVVVIEEIEK